ncbi:peptidase S8/S53 domain-containing protein [Aspergillus fruticulosus]
MVVGSELGICPTCTLVVVTDDRPRKRVRWWYQFPHEKILSQLIATLDDIKRKNRQGKAAINMSFSYTLDNGLPPRFFRLFRRLLQKLDEQGVVVVASANNHSHIMKDNGKIEVKEGIPARRYPAKFADPNDRYGGLPNMVVVSASDWTTQRAYFSNYSPWITTFAPGHNIQCPKDPARAGTGTRTMEACSGTSFGGSS